MLSKEAASLQQAVSNAEFRVHNELCVFDRLRRELVAIQSEKQLGLLATTATHQFEGLVVNGSPQRHLGRALGRIDSSLALPGEGPSVVRHVRSASVCHEARVERS